MGASRKPETKQRRGAMVVSLHARVNPVTWVHEKSDKCCLDLDAERHWSSGQTTQMVALTISQETREFQLGILSFGNPHCIFKPGYFCLPAAAYMALPGSPCVGTLPSGLRLENFGFGPLVRELCSATLAWKGASGEV